VRMKCVEWRWSEWGRCCYPSTLLTGRSSACRSGILAMPRATSSAYRHHRHHSLKRQAQAQHHAAQYSGPTSSVSSLVLPRSVLRSLLFRPCYQRDCANHLCSPKGNLPKLVIHNTTATDCLSHGRKLAQLRVHHSTCRRQRCIYTPPNRCLRGGICKVTVSAWKRTKPPLLLAHHFQMP
jgi:hypothetical protein